jgi:hypothetical protein
MLIEIGIGTFGIIGNLDRLDGTRRTPSYLLAVLPISSSSVNVRGEGLTNTTHDVHTSSRTQAGFKLDWVVTLVWAPARQQCLNDHM